MIDNNKKKRTASAFLSVVVVVVAGCASTPPAPVEDRSLGGHQASRGSGSTRSDGDVYRVRRGDTLYSIAFRNGLDYRELARSNRIDPPFTIFPGQEIRLGGSPPVRQENAASSPRPVSSAPAASANPSTPAVVASSKPPPAPVKPAVASRPAPPPSADSAANSNLVWRWPAEGQVVATYVSGDQTRQGINIAGKSGDPVRATADGEVVYSGNGLIGYGELVIVKHDSTLLSAYGHNRRRLVQEGDKVKAGQQIAEMGSSSATRDMLHFEIRKNGKPVDPMGFLPRR